MTAVGRRDKYNGLDTDTKANLALDEIDLLEHKFDEAIDKMDKALNKVADRVEDLTKRLTQILITIVTGIGVAIVMWLWTAASSAPTP